MLDSSAFADTPPRARRRTGARDAVRGGSPEARLKKVCVITGGSGYIGRFLIRRFLERGTFDLVYNYDIREPTFRDSRVIHRAVDVRLPITETPPDVDPATSWVFNLAALCREPGSRPREYFETNVKGAEMVCAFAERIGVRNLLFTSTMSSYGRMQDPTPENALQCPETPYGISKAIAERIHLLWLQGSPDRRLIMTRPAVIFGPEDTENVPRMIHALRNGYFVFPGSPDIVKAYGYIHGLLDSVEFVMARPERLIVYNYAERDCLPLRGMVKTIQGFLGRRALVVGVPQGLLVPISHFVQFFAGRMGLSNPIHPVRVRKVAFPTNLKPQYLIDHGFEFRYPLGKALEHWKQTSPGDW